MQIKIYYIWDIVAVVSDQLIVKESGEKSSNWKMVALAKTSLTIAILCM